MKWLGIYATQRLAQEAISRYRTQKGFRDAPDNFEIEPYVLDQDYWPGGYETFGDEDFEINPSNGTV